MNEKTVGNKVESVEKKSVAWMSVFSNSFLVLGKFFVGAFVGSVAIISEAIHSCMDLLASVIALWAVRTSVKPPDVDHPYGHGKVENLSSAVEGLLIFIAGSWIIYESILKLLKPQPMNHIWLGVLVMLVSSVCNLVVALKLFGVGRKTNSPALLGDAWHLMTDVWTSAGVMFGLALVWLGGRWFPEWNLQVVDPLVSIFVAFFILHTSVRLMKKAINELMDPCLPQEEMELIEAHIKDLKPVTRGYHKLKTRSVGNFRYIEFHLRVDGNMTVTKAHDLSHSIEHSIEEHLQGSSVIIHFEPCKECSACCSLHCVLNETERLVVQKQLLDLQTGDGR